MTCWPAGGGRVYLWNVINGRIAGTYTIPGRTIVYAVTFASGRRDNGSTDLWRMSSSAT